MKEYQNISHGFGPVYNRESRILIGKFPICEIKGTGIFLRASAESLLESTGGGIEGG